ncbi:GTP cyclohydrolase II RibA [Sphingobacterium sp. DR205]|uniref:GTP cyclohydrolase II RibA n=1 Tax=Sphingobacterium sp. DR205 TaxID=2713573 RepID=UPI0013E43CAA|nr:GTP cyclohydrolase II RibA [Sphingobacterium sp. DR205]QIH33415.1 GTP cyclohydrolase II RibA [Sphingobacterium sp. DR205]
MCKILDKITIPIDLNGTKVNSTFISFYDSEEIQTKEHFVIGLGDFESAEIPLVRIHSECITGDTFHSMRCDCGKQLTEAIDAISNIGGYVIYLRQEGRGIGLFNKFKAYLLQDEGFDTYEANHKLGFISDHRSFDIAADILKALGANKINLLSNNIRKRNALEEAGIEVNEMVSTGVYLNEYNQKYLIAKKNSGNHKLNL